MTQIKQIKQIYIFFYRRFCRLKQIYADFFFFLIGFAMTDNADGDGSIVEKMINRISSPAWQLPSMIRRG